jgi:CheY-like chemotaxis protein
VWVGTDMHALIIEDQALIAMMLEDELFELGFTSFDVASTQEAAIAAAKRRCPDLITADNRLTSGSGIEAVRIICAEQSIPTVYIVGNPHEVRGQLPDTIIVGKPFKRDELREAVQRAAQMVAPDKAMADNS